MNLTHITSHSLRRAISLSEKKDELLTLIAEIESELGKVLTGLASPVVKVIAGPKAAPRRKAVKRGASRPGRSGGLKDRILALLATAGSEGLRVKEIAKKLGSPAPNISVWFSTTGKKLTKKIQPGRYASKGAHPTAVTAKAPVRKKSKMSPAGRAKIAAMMKARWALRRANAGKSKSAKAVKPAKKGFKLKKS